ncbi:MAG: DNA polymerase III subunit [Candidatus Krumholzibacteriota bacterium]
MGRSHFLGRTAVLDKLQKVRAAGKLGQPFLFIGPEGSGKENTALEFARLLNCSSPDSCGPEHLCESCVKALGFQHPDIRWIGPAPASLDDAGVRDLLEKKIANPFHQDPAAATAQVRIGDPEKPEPMTIRSLIHFLRRRAFQSPFKVAVIADGHRMNPAAANAFLKTLEEPPPATVIFLLTSGAEGMLPTILSRCQKIRFEPWAEDELAGMLAEIGGVDDQRARAAARTAEGNARRGLSLLGTEAGILLDWAGCLFEGIHRGDRALAAIAADELHRGAMGHMCVPEDIGAKKLMADSGPPRRDRAIRLCELLNLHYSDAVLSRELGDGRRARLPAAAAMTARAAEVRHTRSLLEDMKHIEDSRREIDRNINIGLAMAVLFEGLIDHAERDKSSGSVRS